jgi:hypothetical protein
MTVTPRSLVMPNNPLMDRSWELPVRPANATRHADIWFFATSIAVGTLAGFACMWAWGWF